jgi:hypothetical protein
LVLEVLQFLVAQLQEVIQVIHQFFQQLLLQQVAEVVLELEHLFQDFLEDQVVEQVEMKQQILVMEILPQYPQPKELMVVNPQVHLGMVAVEVVVQPQQEVMVVEDHLDQKLLVMVVQVQQLVLLQVQLVMLVVAVDQIQEIMHLLELLVKVEELVLIQVELQ